MARQSAQRRLTMLMPGWFGVLGIAIAAVGILGLMAYVLAQRTREIGVRMALGATRSRVMASIESVADYWGSCAARPDVASEMTPHVERQPAAPRS